MSDSPTKELINSPRRQRVVENRTHAFRLASGIVPTAATFKLIKLSDNSVVINNGAAIVSAGIVTLSAIPGALLTAGERYRADVYLQVGAETITPYFLIEADE